jgi:excinuclease UvrABC helicase subunit UvrB
MEREMETAAKTLDFERAAMFRDHIKELRKTAIFSA